jgi:hypothetical protein
MQSSKQKKKKGGVVVECPLGRCQQFVSVVALAVTWMRGFVLSTNKQTSGSSYAFAHAHADDRVTTSATRPLLEPRWEGYAW